MAKRKYKSRVKLWEWIVSIFLAFGSATMIWTNESIDLFTKLGFNIQSGTATVIMFFIMVASGTWISINILRHKRLI